MAWLVLASLVFYAWWNPIYVCLLIGSILINYLLGERINQQLLSKRTKLARTSLGIGLCINIGLLAYYKYADFFLSNVHNLLGSAYEPLNLVLPLAISFFTFQQITYLIDTYKQKVANHDLLEYALFVTFFPQLIAGPIVHHKEMMPQFSQRDFLAFGSNSFAKGISLFNIGLFKKVIIADEFASFANPVFDGASMGMGPETVNAWIGALAYTLQLYFDFSGYSDMAIGLALMFGVVLPINFYSPYKSINIIEFWRRWHMTLSRFLRDYIYIPLGGNRKGEFKRTWFLLLTMLLGGLWHGAGWTFVLWGGLHGCYLIINHLWQQIPIPGRGTMLSRVLSHSVTFIAIVTAWVLFRASDLHSAVLILDAMWSWSPAVVNPTTDTLLLFVAGLGLVWFAPNTMSYFGIPDGQTHPPAKWRWQPTHPQAIGIACLAFIAIINLSRAQEFLYFQF